MSTAADLSKSVTSQPFVASTQAVFSTMLGWDVKLEYSSVVTDYLPKHDVSGIIGFSGALRGTVVVSLDQEVAFAATEAFIGERPSSMNGDIMDAVGEIANMNAGGAKERLNIQGLGLGLPTTVTGKDHRVSFEMGSRVELLQFTSPHGPLSVEIGMAQ